MSYYTDATIADLREVLLVIGIGQDPRAMAGRFIAQSSDPDLVEVLQDLGTDAAGVELVGLLPGMRSLVRAADALQGIEDHDSATVSLSSDSFGYTLTVSPAGLVVEEG